MLLTALSALSLAMAKPAEAKAMDCAYKPAERAMLQRTQELMISTPDPAAMGIPDASVDGCAVVAFKVRADGTIISDALVVRAVGSSWVAEHANDFVQALRFKPYERDWIAVIYLRIRPRQPSDAAPPG